MSECFYTPLSSPLLPLKRRKSDEEEKIPLGEFNDNGGAKVKNEKFFYCKYDCEGFLVTFALGTCSRKSFTNQAVNSSSSKSTT